MGPTFVFLALFHLFSCIDALSIGTSEATRNALIPRQSTLWPRQSFVTQPSFKPPVLAFNRSGQTANGVFFMGPDGPGAGSPAPIIMSDTGDLVWQGPPGNNTNVAMQIVRGVPYLTYWLGNSTAAQGVGYGAVSFLDSTYSLAYRVCLSTLRLVTVDGFRNPCNVDMHESVVTPQGTLLVTVANVTTADLSSVGGPKNGWIFDSIFLEVDIPTETILFQWRSSDHLTEFPFNNSKYPLSYSSPYGSFVFGRSQRAPWDYFHINSVTKFNNNYIVSSRTYWTVLNVNSADGSVGWKIQGFNNGSDIVLDDAARFKWQHDVRVLSGNSDCFTLTMHNNYNSEVDTGTGPTTGLAINVQISAKTGTVNQRLLDPKDLLYVGQMGSYQPLANGNTLLGHGVASRIKEYDQSGNVVYSAQFGQAPPYTDSYRVFRIDNWNATPTVAPIAVVQQGKVYLSWNGATIYDSWQINGGSSPSALSQIAKVSKTGFETNYTFAQTPKYVQGLALKAGVVLARSNVVTT